MRKPYERPMPLTWWLNNSAYFVFLLRELSSVFAALIVLEVLCFALQVSGGPEAMDRFVGSLRSPGWLVFHVVALAFALLHTVTWFQLAPRVLVVRFGEEKLPAGWVAGANYAAWIAASVLVWWIVV